jgi:crotonobetainyl-CoA:carnitine CoA-transferase CaiB-like acyl-CoA transferase
LLASAVRAHPVGHWEALLAAHGVPATAVRRATQAAAEAATDAATPWPQVELPSAHGSRRVPVPGIGFASTEALTVDLRSPVRRGADTRALLSAAGLDDTTINAMLADGTAWEPAP